MQPSVKSVTYKEGYILSIDFDNGEHGFLDMEPYLNFGVFKKIKDTKMFTTVHVSFDTIAWDSGADLDPEFVYTKCVKSSVVQHSSPENVQTSHS